MDNLKELLSNITDEEGNIPKDNVSKLLSSFEDYNSGLKKNSEKLLSEKKQTQEELRKIKELYTGVDLDEYNQYKQRKKEKMSNGSEEEKLLLLKSELDKTKKEKEEILKKFEETNSKFEQKTIKETVADLLGKVGVNKQTLKKAALAMWKDEARLLDGTVFIGDKPADDFINEWTESAEAKDFISAPVNKGGDYKQTGGEQAPVNAALEAFKKGAGL